MLSDLYFLKVLRDWLLFVIYAILFRTRLHIDWLFIIVLRVTVIRYQFWCLINLRSYGDVIIAGEGLQILGLCLRLAGLWKGIFQYRATSVATQNFGVWDLIRRTAPPRRREYNGYSRSFYPISTYGYKKWA
jgi:hypothetical protein